MAQQPGPWASTKFSWQVSRGGWQPFEWRHLSPVMAGLPFLHGPWTPLGSSPHTTTTTTTCPFLTFAFCLEHLTPWICHSSSNPAEHLLFQADLQRLLPALGAWTLHPYSVLEAQVWPHCQGRPKAHQSVSLVPRTRPAQSQGSLCFH